MLEELDFRHLEEVRSLFQSVVVPLLELDLEEDSDGLLLRGGKAYLLLLFRFEYPLTKNRVTSKLGIPLGSLPNAFNRISVAHQVCLRLVEMYPIEHHGDYSVFRVIGVKIAWFINLKDSLINKNGRPRKSDRNRCGCSGSGQAETYSQAAGLSLTPSLGGP